MRQFVGLVYADSNSVTHPMPYKDKTRQREYAKVWIAKRREDFFRDKVCEKCGSDKKLELDHINPEEKVSHRIWSWSKDRRDKEIEKCQVLCTECHKEKTNEWKSSFVKHGTITMYYKRGCRCSLCVKANSEYKKKNRAKRKALGLSYQ